MNRKITFAIALAFVALMVIGSASAGIFEFKGEGEDTVRIGYLPSDHDAALFVADAKGYFEKQDLNVDLIKFNNGNELMKAMESGEIDVGYVGIAPVLYSIGNGGTSKIISSAQNEGSGLVVSESSGITSASDLSGKNIATPGEGTIQELLLSYYLNENGLSTKDLKVSTLKAPSMKEALENGQADGAMTFQPYVTQAESNGNILLANSSDILPKHPCCVVAASDDFIKNHAEEAEKVVAIHKKATKYINDNIKKGKTGKVVKLLPKEIVQDEELEKESLESFPFTSGMSGNFKSNTMTFQQLEAAMGAIKDPVPQDQIFWEA